MADIKVKESKKGTIKTLNKAVVGTQRIKNEIVQTKEKIGEETMQEENTSNINYAMDRISDKVANTPNNLKRINKINTYGKSKYIETRENIKKSVQKIKYAKKKENAKINSKNTIKNSMATGEKVIKTANQPTKIVKNEKTKNLKNSPQVIKNNKLIIENTTKGVKTASRKAITAVKKLVINTKSMVTALLALGWVGILIVIIIALIASFLTFFYHGDENGNAVVWNEDIVEIAKTQIGQKGGEPFWSWYGFDSRVEWCACFVSWCANQCGYIESGIIPKFASCESEGVSWFKNCELWQDVGYIPKAGDIIFFDWADSNDDIADHVGIVEKCENGKIYTIEGNAKGDVCKQNIYDINSTEILGYGTPMYWQSTEIKD